MTTIRFPPPRAPVREVTDIYYGHTVVDPYRWMEDLRSGETTTWMKAQSDYAHRYLEHLPLRNELLQRLIDVTNVGATITDIQRRGRYLFYFKLEPGSNDRKIYLRDGFNGAEQLLVDPEAISTLDTHFSITSFSVSSDGHFLSYLLSGGGAEFGELHVIETASGRATGDRIEQTRWEAGWWLPDNRSFAYLRFQNLSLDVRPPEHLAHIRIYLHELGANSADDRALFGWDVHPNIRFAPELMPSLSFPLGSPYLLAVVYSGVPPNAAFYCVAGEDLKQNPIPWQRLADLEDDVSEVAIHDNMVYLLTYRDATRYKLIRTDLANHDLMSATDVVPASEAVIERFATAKDALYVQTLDGGSRRLLRVDYANGTVQPVPLPYDGSAEIAVADSLQSGVLFTIHSWTKSTALYAYDPANHTVANTNLIPPIALDMSDIEIINVKVPSHDGVLIPVVILCKRGVKLDGSNPTLLYGYGAYGFVTTAPMFRPQLLPWFERGGIYVLVGVRGGGEYGEEWHQAGKQTTKPNTWKDFIACAEYVVLNQYTSPEHVAGEGRSAGGILISNAIAERPDLFAAAIISVGLTNALRFETTAGGPPNIPEFGSIQTEAGFQAIFEMDAYHKIKQDVAYPAVLLTHGINDPRVEPWFSAKMAARLQQASTSDRPVLLRIDYDAGHGMGFGFTKQQYNELLADTFAFLFQQLQAKV
jgi:prolyl oligopeptidase